VEKDKLSEPIEKSIESETLQDSMQQQKEGEAIQPEALTRAQRKKLKRNLFKEEKSLERGKKEKKKKIYTISLVTIFLIIVSTGIFFKINKSTTEVPTADIVATGETKEFNMIARQFSFSPSTIEVNRGNKVKLTITSVDVTHGIAIPKYGIDEVLSPNRVVNIEFIADKPGTFPFVCSVSCGSGHAGMRGKLVVK